MSFVGAFIFMCCFFAIPIILCFVFNEAMTLKGTFHKVVFIIIVSIVSLMFLCAFLTIAIEYNILWMYLTTLFLIILRIIIIKSSVCLYLISKFGKFKKIKQFLISILNTIPKLQNTCQWLICFTVLATIMSFTPAAIRVMKIGNYNINTIELNQKGTKLLAEKNCSNNAFSFGKNIKNKNKTLTITSSATLNITVQLRTSKEQSILFIDNNQKKCKITIPNKYIEYP